MKADKLKLIRAVLIVAGGLGAFYYFGDSPDLIRLGVLLAAAVLEVIFLRHTVISRHPRGISDGSLA